MWLELTTYVLLSEANAGQLALAMGVAGVGSSLLVELKQVKAEGTSE